MPEGPSIVILREQAAGFAGKVIRRAGGNAKIDMARLCGKRIHALRSFGKQFLIDLGDDAVRIHLLMFGSYRIDERKEAVPRLGLAFGHGELNFYGCSVRLVEGPLDAAYDRRADVMSDAWDPALTRRKLRALPDTLVCDALLDQDLFAGVGNIIKNEVLYRTRIHPLSTLGALPPRKLRKLAEQARVYAFEFLEWKKASVLRQRWLVHHRVRCPRHAIPLQGATWAGRVAAAFTARCARSVTGAPSPALPAHPHDPAPALRP